MKRGDVVLIDSPYSDRSGSKLRPALVVQDDALSRARHDTILAAITRTRRFPDTDVFVDVSSPDGRLTGLRQDSVIDCALLGAFDRQLVQHVLGTLPAPLMQQVDSALRRDLGL